MRDPVILPSTQASVVAFVLEPHIETSTQRVDRSTIVQHLLSSETDPFSRQHLTVDLLKPGE